MELKEYGNLRRIDLSGMNLTRSDADRRKAVKKESFDRLNDESYVSQFADRLQDGDEVYYFSNTGILSGSAGYILVRDGQVVAQTTVTRS